MAAAVVLLVAFLAVQAKWREPFIPSPQMAIPSGTVRARRPELAKVA